ncbi:hypothetical protein EIK77_004695 [Talaromyces pinophilus]|nr:hypothetical protein EIK77_004695 [Talaromyces pinophilus]
MASAPSVAAPPSTTQHAVIIVIEENGVRLRLNIVDTPGYGDQVNNDRWYDFAIRSEQEILVLTELAGTPSSNTSKISTLPTSARSSQLSASKLSDVVNVVPVIAKSDSLTLEERQAFKERIKEEFTFHNLKMYPYDNDELDDEERVMNVQIKVGATTSTAAYGANESRISSPSPSSEARRTLS